MLCRRSPGGRGGKVEKRDPFEDETLPTGGRDGAPLGGFDPQAVEKRDVDLPRVRRGVGHQSEPAEKNGGVVRSLRDEYELFRRVGDSDLRERSRKLVVARDEESELGAPVPKAGFAATAGTAEMGPGREEVALARDGPGIEEGDEGGRLLREIAERPNDLVRRGGTGMLAPGADHPDGAFLGRGQRHHRTEVTPA